MSNLMIAWIIVLAACLFLVGMLGLRTSAKRWWGVLIDDRNKYSLSRLQLVLWTMLIVPLFLAVGLVNKSMNVDLPDEILSLLGISVASTAGALMIKGNKAATEPDPNKVQALAAGSRIGVLQVNDPSKPKEAPSFLDIFLGEEIVDYKYIDVSKLQMFLFTIAAWIGYGYVLWTSSFALTAPLDSAGNPIAGAELVASFPGLSASLVTLIGLSHAGYLTMKATRKTPVQ